VKFAALSQTRRIVQNTDKLVASRRSYRRTGRDESRPQIVRKLGLSYVRSQLSRRSWKVTSPRESASVASLAHSDEGSRMLTIKVRVLSQRAAVPLGATLDNLLADYMFWQRRKSRSWPTET